VTSSALDNSPLDPQSYYDGLPAHGVDALWKYLGALLPKEPISKATPHLWNYAEVRELLMQAGEIVTAEEAERRVLMLQNPGLLPKVAAVTNVYAGLQLVLPGEVAPAHHHAAAALRFVVEGAGGYTTVDGAEAWMEPGDLVLTPSWTRHEHGNPSDGPMIWLDGLDLPLINDLEANFLGGPRPENPDAPKMIDASGERFARAGLRPPGSWSAPYSPLIRYPWKESEAALAAAARPGRRSPEDGVLLAYSNPTTGGPIMPTLGAAIQLLESGTHTEAHRHTSSAVYHVVRGKGTTIVDGIPLDWGEKDTFAVPGWAVHEHLSTGDGDSILFSMTDEPVQRVLGFYREFAAPQQD
jgi:gentisate 1,2-dioxygenase